MEWIIIAILGFYLWAYIGGDKALREDEMRKREQRNAYQRDYYYRKKLKKGKK